MKNYTPRIYMAFKLYAARQPRLAFYLAAFLVVAATVGFADNSNIIVRIMAANLTSGNNQRYESAGLDIFKGLKPDVVCVQEFNYASTNGLGTGTPAAMREMVDSAFGTNFSYFRESGYAIPNGIISRYPIVASGSWIDSDTGMNDRGFAWTQIHLPGTNDLYVVSIHIKASSDSASRRGAEALELAALIHTNFPANAWIVVAGDCNTYSQSEACMNTFTSYLSDQPIPADQNGGMHTNAGRNERYDRVMPSFSFTNLQVPVTVGTSTFNNGLVFDSRITPYLIGVSPIQPTDSGASGMQHMGIVKDFKIAFATTNIVNVPQPFLVMSSADIISWSGVSNLAYTVQTITDLASTNWSTLGTTTSSTTNFSYTYSSVSDPQRFYRVVYP
jgi:endonuclease/exonuclease/phosphatase family metal-dependent hydrolase